MPDKEKEIIRNLVETVPKLSEEKQNYILGVAEGMALAKESQNNESKMKS